jgi:hypothetical protein
MVTKRSPRPWAWWNRCGVRLGISPFRKLPLRGLAERFNADRGQRNRLRSLRSSHAIGFRRPLTRRPLPGVWRLPRETGEVRNDRRPGQLGAGDRPAVAGGWRA